VLTTGIAVTGAGLVTGAVLLGTWVSKGTPISSSSFMGTCADLKAAYASRDRLGNAAITSFISAGAAGIGTLAYGLATSRTLGKTGLRILPSVTASGSGVWVDAAW
jgi:hypothetical protein